jgi:flagellar FliJ protein
MSRFRFALEPLLRARRAVEERVQRRVAEIERERQALEDRLRAQQLHIAQGKRALREGLIGSVNMPGLRLHAADSIQLLRAGHRIVLALAGVHQRLEAARRELVEAARQRRAIEILRERRFEEWKQGMEKSETAALDELAVIRAAGSGR